MRKKLGRTYINQSYVDIVNEYFGMPVGVYLLRSVESSANAKEYYLVTGKPTVLRLGQFYAVKSVVGVSCRALGTFVANSPAIGDAYKKYPVYLLKSIDY